MQGLLLRFMETGELQKVGADRIAGRVNVRVIAATNRNLRDMISAGHVPRGPVLPPERHPSDGAAAARAPRGHSGADRLLHAAVHAEQRLHPVKFISPDAMQAAVRTTRGPATSASWRTSSSGCVVTGRTEIGDARDLPMEIRMQQTIGLRPKRERRRTVADDLYKKLDRGARVVLDCGLSALHAARDHARQRARPGAQGARGRARQLQDRREAVQHGVSATTSGF